MENKLILTSVNKVPEDKNHKLWFFNCTGYTPEGKIARMRTMSWQQYEKSPKSYYWYCEIPEFIKQED